MPAKLLERSYSEALLPEALTLARLTLGNSGAVAKSESFWRWKHHKNPAGQSYGLAMWDASCERLAGLRLLMRWGFEDCDGQPVLAVRAVDTATHPDYRRQGIFSHLTVRAIEVLAQGNTQFIYNTPNVRSLPGYLKLGWHDLGKLPVYIRLLRPLRALYRLARARAHSRERKISPIHFMPWSEFFACYQRELANLSDQWEQMRPCLGLRTRRTLAYYDWRYGQHPHVDYAVCVLHKVGDPNQLAGFAVVRQKIRHGLQELILAELCLTRLDRQLGLALIRKIVRNACCDYVVAHFGNGTFERKLVQRAGFVPVPRQGLQFAVRSLRDATMSSIAQRGWDLTLGDLEIF